MYLFAHGYSVADYVLISSCFSDFVERLIVTDRLCLTIHLWKCLVKFQMEIEENQTLSNLVTTEKLVWCTKKVEMFVNPISSQEFRDKIVEALCLIENRPDE